MDTFTLNSAQAALHQEIPMALLSPVQRMRESHRQDANTRGHPGVRANRNAFYQLHANVTGADRSKPEKPRQLIRDRKLVEAISDVLNGKHEFFLGVGVKLDQSSG